MWTVLYWTHFDVSINVWRLAGDTLNITCNFLYCNHQMHRDFLITRYTHIHTSIYIYIYIYIYYLRVKEQRNILREISKRKANWIGHNLRRNCLLQQVIEGKIKGRIEVTGRRERRRRKLRDDLRERRGYSYLKEEALDRNMWRARLGRGFGPVVRQTAKWIIIRTYLR
jgi:hypothetical protein